MIEDIFLKANAFYIPWCLDKKRKTHKTFLMMKFVKIIFSYVFFNSFLDVPLFLLYPGF